MQNWNITRYDGVPVVRPRGNRFSMTMSSPGWEMYSMLINLTRSDKSRCKVKREKAKTDCRRR